MSYNTRSILFLLFIILTISLYTQHADATWPMADGSHNLGNDFADGYPLHTFKIHEGDDSGNWAPTGYPPSNPSDLYDTAHSFDIDTQDNRTLREVIADFQDSNGDCIPDDVNILLGDLPDVNNNDIADEYEGRNIAFVIDDSGSMEGDIDDVKSVAQQLVSEWQNDDHVYYLITFSHRVSSAYMTTDVSELADAIDNIVANGGADCGEFAIEGLQQAFEATRLEYSQIFFCNR